MAAGKVSTVGSSSRQPREHRLRVLIFAGSSLMRAGLERLLEPEASIEVLGSISTYAELASSVASREPDAILIHGDGVNLASLHRGIGMAQAQVVLLADRIDERLIFDALSHGGAGILLADSSSPEVAAALHAAAAGLITFSKGAGALLTQPLDNRHVQNHEGDSSDGLAEELTPREREVLEMMVEGLSNKEIAVQLNLSVHTVKFHISSILAKLGAASRTEATTIGLRRGLITI